MRTLEISEDESRWDIAENQAKKLAAECALILQGIPPEERLKELRELSGKNAAENSLQDLEDAILHWNGHNTDPRATSANIARLDYLACCFEDTGEVHKSRINGRRGTWISFLDWLSQNGLLISQSPDQPKGRGRKKEVYVPSVLLVELFNFRNRKTRKSDKGNVES